MPSPECFHSLFVEQDLPHPEFRPPVVVVQKRLIIAVSAIAFTCLALRLFSTMTDRPIVLIVILVFSGFAFIVTDHNRVMPYVSMSSSPTLTTHTVAS